MTSDHTLSHSVSGCQSHSLGLLLSQSLIRECPSFSLSLSQSLSLPGPQPLSLSAPERIHEIHGSVSLIDSLVID